MLGTLDACFQDLNKDEIAISFVAAHLGKYDRRIQHLVCTKEIKTREKLLRELKYFSVGQRPFSDTSGYAGPLDAKRKKPNRSYCKNKDVTCYKCRSKGHYSFQCSSSSTQNPEGKKVRLRRTSDNSHIMVRSFHFLSIVGQNIYL